MDYNKRQDTHVKVNYEMNKKLYDIIKQERKNSQTTQKKLIQEIIENGLIKYFKDKYTN
jgi:hypothetical protein